MKLRTRSSRLARVGAAVAVLTWAGWAQAGVPIADDPVRHWRVSSGVNFTSGDYGLDDDTDILYVPITVRYDHEPFILKLTVPYIRIEGPGGVVAGTDGSVIVDEESVGTETNAGLGDVVLSGSYVHYPDGGSSWPILELTGKVKFPTADEDQFLGTGKFDYTLQADVSKNIGRFLAFTTLGYRFLGDPSGSKLNDVFFASLGGGVRVVKDVQVGLVYDYGEASSSSSSDSHEFVPYFSWKLADRYRLSGYAVAGVSRGAADWGSGVSLGLDF
ncbi:MAG: hypothetical protein JRG83_15905 [Deltaproteobacteria bacterium]|nr:hypothetical protein [Deltaproteobacteria bacterium]